jgi:hypothetical protein
MTATTASLGALRNGTWLTEDRARFYGFVLAGVGIFLLAAFYVHILGDVFRAAGKPLASDFDTFWAASRLALQGHATEAYNSASLRAAEAEAAKLGANTWFVYLYPPPFLLLSLPLGLLPYLTALAGFLVASFTAWAMCMARLVPSRWPLLPLLSLPVGILNLIAGQNGYVSATCFAAAALWLEASPVAAGIALGCLVFKPHLALAVPVVLLAARRWTALAACAATACCLIVLSWAVLGTEVWRHFAHSAPLASLMLQSPEIWPKMASVFSELRLLHASTLAAGVAQGAAAVLALALVIGLARRRPGGIAEIAAMAPAAMLCTPYVWDYDMVSLGLPMAWIAREGMAQGWRPWEKTLLACLFIAPASARALNVTLGLPVMPPLLLALLVLLLVRARQPRPA